MKITTKILALVFWIIILGCGQTANQNANGINENDGINPNTSNHELNKTESQNPTKEEIIDSLRLETALKDAFKNAQTAFHADHFSNQYTIQPDDSSYSIKIDILIGKLFKDKQKYFLLRRHVPWATYLNLYKVQDDNTEKLIDRRQGGMTYIRDTIFDVNGDGHNDFLVHWYPSSGCCRRDMYHVYLNQPGK